MLKGREEECLNTLSYLRNRPAEDPTVQYEFRSLQAERLVEREAAKERYGYNDVNFRVSVLEYKRLLTTKSLLHRLLIGASAQALQQWTGINGKQRLVIPTDPSYYLLCPYRLQVSSWHSSN